MKRHIGLVDSGYVYSTFGDLFMTQMHFANSLQVNTFCPSVKCLTSTDLVYMRNNKQVSENLRLQHRQYGITVSRIILPNESHILL